MTPDVLIVDDQPAIRFLLEIVTKEVGLNSISANNGMEAIEKVQSFGPQVVIMDIKMPVMNGLEALEKIKKVSNAKVVIMSAYTDKKSLEQARKLGAYRCLCKPFDVNDIKDILKGLFPESKEDSLKAQLM